MKCFHRDLNSLRILEISFVVGMYASTVIAIVFFYYTQLCLRMVSFGFEFIFAFIVNILLFFMWVVLRVCRGRGMRLLVPLGGVLSMLTFFFL